MKSFSNQTKFKFDKADSYFQIEVDSANFYIHEDFQDMSDHQLLSTFQFGQMDFTTNNLCMIKIEESITALATQNGMDIQIPYLPGRTLTLM